MSEFVEIAKELCLIANDLDKVTIDTFKSIDKETIEKRKQNLDNKIKNASELPSQSVAEYAILSNIDDITLDKIGNLLQAIENKKDYENLFRGDLKAKIIELVKNYKKEKPFQNWTPESILKHSYYFTKYNNQEIIKKVSQIAELIKSSIGLEGLNVRSNSFYVSRLQDDAWFVLYYGGSHRDSAQIYMSFRKDNLVYGLGKGENFDTIDGQNAFINEISVEKMSDSSFEEIINFYKNKVVPKFIEINGRANNNPKNGGAKMTTKKSLNQILYGPPGTGKTYNMINRALEIIFDKENADRPIKFKILQEEKLEDIEMSYSKILDTEDVGKKRRLLKGLFDHFKDTEKQIIFTTFHQSYGYEEFVEGIKAIPIGKNGNEDGEEMIYDVVDGVFKKLCISAQLKAYESKNTYFQSDAKVWKISLGGAGLGHQVKQDCFDNGEIRIGWADIKEIGDEEFVKLGSKDKNTLRNFIEEMSEGDIVVSLGSSKEIDAIGIIIGEHEIDEYPHYPHKRKVEWIVTNSKISIYEINGKTNLTLQTVYRLQRLNPEIIMSILPEEAKKNIEKINSDKNYILIIDEINRGNISKIFGELITLIEESKRIGADEEIRVSLPYSGMEFDGGRGFGVPKNVYIIGTMNTADRSIALMDTALRRRFHFEEMMPDYEVLKELEVDGIKINEMLETINKRIEYLYDRDHQIGHAYFMSLKDKNAEEAKAELDNIFRNKIIPLLQEYFYDDWEKILMVLGEKGFIEKNEIKNNIFSYTNEDIIEDKKYSYRIKEFFDYSEFKQGADNANN